MNILVCCEYSGIVREAFRKKGHEVLSCDFLPTELPGPHYEGNVLEILYEDDWDMLIAHPECTYLASSGLHWNKKDPARALKTEEALVFVKTLLDAPIPKICLENPVGRIGTAIRKADQYIQPYEFGHNASKKTGLWLKGLPKLKPTKYIEPRIVIQNEKEYKRWANQTDSGQNKLAPSATRGKDRSKTYQGIADAMAEQWG